MFVLSIPTSSRNTIIFELFNQLKFVVNIFIALQALMANDRWALSTNEYFVHEEIFRLEDII